MASDAFFIVISPAKENVVVTMATIDAIGIDHANASASTAGQCASSNPPSAHLCIRAHATSKTLPFGKFDG
jgi:hypothetical protein